MSDLQQRETPLRQIDANDLIRKFRRFKLPDEVYVDSDMSLEEFITRFVKEWANKYDTVYAASGGVQTEAGKRRSLGDITRLAQYYFPDDKVCLEKVKNILKDLISKKQISTSVCRTILKRVFFYRTTRAQTIEHLDERDEFGWLFNIEKKTRVPKKFS